MGLGIQMIVNWHLISVGEFGVLQQSLGTLGTSL